MALNIVLHTFRMIFGNLGQALRVSIGPYAILIIVSVGLFVAAGVPNALSGDPSQLSTVSPVAALIPLILFPLILFVTAWVAVSWHRFILLEEYSGILPDVSGRPIWPYAGKALLLGFMLMLVAIPVFLVLGTAVIPLLGGGVPTDPSAGVPIFGILVFAIATLLLTILSLRWGIALVGTALGKPMGFGDAWRETKPISGIISGVAVILVVINVGSSFILNPLAQAVPLIGVVLQLMLTWLTMMLGISILTTLYGHVVEKRPLVS